MKWTPFPFVGGAYKDEDRPLSVQDTVNWLPTLAEQEGARTGTFLRSPPGLRDEGAPDDDDYDGGPHRGARDVEGKLFLVIGDGFYQRLNDGSFSRKGTVPGRSLVSMTHNQITNGNQVVIGNGSQGFVYNTVTQVFAPITDSGFPGFANCDFMNQLIVGLEPQRRFMFPSALVDALSYDTTERFAASASPDRIRTIKVARQELLAFGERTTQAFAYTGVTNFLFQDKGVGIDRGAASTFCVVSLDNTVAFVGNDGRVYMLQGYSPLRISDEPIEQALAQSDLSKCFAFGWDDRGHSVYYLTCPDGMTFGYDFATREWHRRKSKGMDRWRLNTMVKWNGDWYGGSCVDGRFFRLDWSWFAEGEGENEEEMVSERTCGVLHDNENWVKLGGLRMVFDAGQPGADPHTCQIALSRNGGNTFGNFTYHSIGTTGQFSPPVERYRMGRGRQFVMRVRVSTNRKRDLLACSLKASSA